MRAKNIFAEWQPGLAPGVEGDFAAGRERRAWEVYRRRFVSTCLAATLLADGAPCFATCARPALVSKRDCSYISIHFSLEIAEISLPIGSSGKSSGNSKMNATLPHVELLPRRLQPLELTRTPKRAHQVKRAVVLLRRERDVADRLLVVSVWVARQGDRPSFCRSLDCPPSLVPVPNSGGRFRPGQGKTCVCPCRRTHADSH